MTLAKSGPEDEFWDILYLVLTLLATNVERHWAANRLVTVHLLANIASDGHAIAAAGKAARQASSVSTAMGWPFSRSFMAESIFWP